MELIIENTATPPYAEIRSALKQNGFYLFPNALSHEFCQETMAFIDAHAEDEDVDHHYQGSEVRIWNTEKKSPSLQAFFHACTQMMESVLDTKLQPGTLLGIRNKPLDKPGPGNLNGRWHLDSFLTQWKGFVFLNDTHEESGAFECLKGSHRPSLKARLLAQGHLFHPLDFIQGRKRRYQSLDENLIENLQSKGDWQRTAVEVSGGTFMIVNTSAIHRARPCLKGSRYALTAYYD